MTEYSYNVNKNYIEKNGKFVAYVDVIDTKRIVDLLNEQEEEIKSLKLENQLLLEEMKEIRDKLTIYLKIKKGDAE